MNVCQATSSWPVQGFYLFETFASAKLVGMPFARLRYDPFLGLVPWQGVQLWGTWGPTGYLARRRPHPEPRWRSGSPGRGRRRWRQLGPTCSHTPSPTGHCSRSPRGPRWRNPRQLASCHRLSRLWALKGEQRSARMKAGCWSFNLGGCLATPHSWEPWAFVGAEEFSPTGVNSGPLALNTPSILEWITPWEE